MKKYFYLLVAVMCLSQVSKAAPGDTTWVQANNTELTYPGNFDTAVVFPNTGITYRKILMEFTLGKYACPGNPQYCGSWDYLVDNYVMTPGGDTMEISRLITPYATTSTYFPANWTYNYIFDVTDYAAYLKDSAAIRINYGGFSYGFIANVRFAFIEGTPDRNVIGIQRLWNGNFNYGVSTDPITNYIYNLPVTVPANTSYTDLKMRITGHGEDGNDCNEFCSNNYTVLLNNNNITTQTFFRTTCGQNPVYSQTGTWPFDRANWCPGALVYDIYNPLPVTTAGVDSVNITFPPYTTIASSSGNSTPYFDIEAAAIYYGAINKTLDASLEEIISPNDASPYSRTNAVCGDPTIHVHNAGSTTITSLSINYGVVGGTTGNYTWSGSLAPLQDTEIVLPSVGSDLLANAGLTTTQQFTATIAQVNGTADDDATNNTLTSSFTPTPLWPNNFAIRMTTATLIQYPASWEVLDMNNNIIAQEINMQSQTLYVDTLNLPSGCYKLWVSTPDEMGLIPEDYYGSGQGVDNGSIAISKVQTVGLLTMPNYHGGDFGTGLTQYFATSPFPASVTNVEAGNVSLEAYPNPAQNSVTVNINGLQTVNGTIKMIGMIGRVMLEKSCNNATQILNVSNLANGVYTIIYFDASAPDSKLQTRLLIAK